MGLALGLALLIGLTLGLLGGGGSILAVPALVYALGLETKPAIATSLLVVGVTSAAALLPHARSRNVRWRTGLVFGTAGMLGAYGGGQLARWVPGQVLLLLFAAMMVVTALAMWRGRAATRLPAGAMTARPTLKIVADGLAVGLATGLVGAGGGFLVVPALVLLGGLPMAAAVGTSLLVIAMKSLAGFLGYAAHVAVDYELAFGFSAVAVVGSLLGARLVAAVDPDRLRRGFAVFVLFMAGFMVYRERAVFSAIDPWVAAGALAVAVAALALLGRRGPAALPDSRPFGPIRRLVLVGAGHAHVEVLRRWALARDPDVELTLVVDRPVSIYSGMVPGFVAGQYAAEELEIDVRRLARYAGARLIPARVTRIDPEARLIEAHGVPAIPYDVLSLNVGSAVAGLDLPGVREHAVATRPIAGLVEAIDEIRAKARAFPRAEPFRVAVVGAGSGGVELAFCLRERLLSDGVVDPRVVLLDSGPELLPGATPRLRKRIGRAAARRGIGFRGGVRVAAIEGGSLLFKHGEKLEWEALIWVAGAAAHAFPGRSLPVDERGFVRVEPTLQVVGHPEIFAAGDCASLAHAPAVPKAGVYAVRAGPVLASNLRRYLQGEALKDFRPQSDFLSILNLGDGTAIAAKWGRTLEGRWVLRLKDRIDRSFMEKYR